MNIIGFETAKLAKEKGFSEKSFYYYDNNGKAGVNFEISSFISSTAVITYLDFKEDFNKIKDHFSAPYMVELLDWLREKHNIIIELSISAINTTENKVCYTYSIYKDITFVKKQSYLDSYLDYYECLENALRKSLQLIN